MKTEKKQVANIFLCVVFVLIGSLVVPVKPAQAVVPVHCPTICDTWDVALSGPKGSVVQGWFVNKEFGLGGLPFSASNEVGSEAAAAFSISWDLIAWELARFVLQQFTEKIVLWIQTGQDPFFSGGTEGSLFVTNIDEFLLDAADNQASIMLRDYFGPSWDKLCSPFRLPVGLSLSQSYGRGYGSFGPKARCSITDIVENLEDFYEDFENGGWAAWMQTARYENTAWGLLTLAEEDSRERETRAVRANENDFLAGLGFPGMRKCVKGITVDGGPLINPTDPDDTNLVRCDKYLTQTPGKAIEDQLADSLGEEIRKLEAADEINEIIGHLFSGLMAWLIGGGSGGGGLLDTELKGGGEPPPTSPQCADGKDNDGDGLIDLADPGCASSSDNSEENIIDPPVECSDGKDNDGDGLIDLADPGCTGPTDTTELNAPSL